MSSKSWGAPLWCAFRGSLTPGSASYSTRTASAPSFAAYAVSPTTTATGSPTYRTLPEASAGRGGTLMLGSIHPHGSAPTLTSCAVYTATTPDTARAGAVSTSLSRPRAGGPRPKAAQAMPGRLKSSTDWPDHPTESAYWQYYAGRWR